MQLVFVGHRCCDHSPSSGYDQICSLFPEAGWLEGRALQAGRLEWIREPAAPGAPGPQLFHVFYGDCSGKPLPAILRERFPGAIVVSSAHQPVNRLRQETAAWDAIAASDAIITVSEVQARELHACGLRIPIHAVAHGVWTRVFRAATPAAHRDHVLLVGSVLRDWTAATQVAAGLAEAGVRCVAVGAGPRSHLVSEGTPIEVLPWVSEDMLARMYAAAAAVFLPFLDATASNALLEAMAAGCPAVMPRLPSLVDEYVGDDLDAVDPGRHDLAIARLLHYVRSPEDRAARSQALRARADRFDWARLKPRYAAVFDSVATRPGCAAV